MRASGTSSAYTPSRISRTARAISSATLDRLYYRIESAATYLAIPRCQIAVSFEEYRVYCFFLPFDRRHSHVNVFGNSRVRIGGGHYCFELVSALFIGQHPSSISPVTMLTRSAIDPVNIGVVKVDQRTRGQGRPVCFVDCTADRYSFALVGIGREFRFPGYIVGNVAGSTPTDVWIGDGICTQCGE